MTNPVEQVERHLIRASGSAILAFVAATVAYALKGVHWILSHEFGLQTAAFDNVIGVINWMGGPMDVGFYAFLASEGIQSMVFATLERNEWRRRVEEGKRQVEESERRAEESERQVEESKRRVEEGERRLEEGKRQLEEGERRLEKERAEKEAAEQRIRELEKQIADSNGSRREDAS